MSVKRASSGRIPSSVGAGDTGVQWVGSSAWGRVQAHPRTPRIQLEGFAEPLVARLALEAALELAGVAVGEGD